MQITYATRGHLVATLMVSALLAALGFQVASWWGAVAGAVVGAVIAARMMLRGVAEPGASQARTMILTTPAQNSATLRTGVNRTDIRGLH